LKDRRAVTRQWVSIPATRADRVPELNTAAITVLEQHRHGNKLRTGHLAGNRFQIVVRNVQRATPVASPTPSPADDLTSLWHHLCHTLQSRGFPNYYGEQRFGHDHQTLELGWNLLTGRQAPRDIPYPRRRFLLKLALSAVQSELFNRTLAQRLQDQLLETVVAGDVMQVVASGGLFVVEDQSLEQRRCTDHETVITGPMFGRKMKSPQEAVAEREAAVLAAAGLTPAMFDGFGDLLSGTRRPYLIRPSALSVTRDPAGWRLQFTLPPGVYATTLLREVLVEADETEGAV
jgi:tRNA pseudouridine13 synthase